MEIGLTDFLGAVDEQNINARATFSVARASFCVLISLHASTMIIGSHAVVNSFD